MNFSALNQIRKRSRAEYRLLLKQQWTTLRIWIQENGEFAFLSGILMGVLLVSFARFVIGLIALLTVFALLVYYLAEEKTENS